MILSETKNGANWIAQFASQDQDLVASFLDSLDIIPLKTFKDELTVLINSLCVGKENVAFFLKLPLEYPQAIYNLREKKGYICRGSISDTLTYAHQNYSFLTEKQQTAAEKSCIIARQIALYDVLKAVQQNHSTLLINPSDTLASKRKIRHCYILTDLIMLGVSMRNFFLKMWQTPTIRNWYAGRLITIECISYGCSPQGERLLTRGMGKYPVLPSLPVHTVRTIKGFPQQGKPQKNLAHLQNIITDYNPKPIDFYQRRYSSASETQKKTLKQQSSRNYNRVNNHTFNKKHEILDIILEQGYPIHLPNILCKTTKHWVPLFPPLTSEKKGSKGHCLDLSSHPRDDNFIILLNKVLGKNNSFLKASKPQQEKIMTTKLGNKALGILSLLGNQRSNLHSIASQLGLSYYESWHSVEQMGRLKWIQPNSLYLTNQGRKICTVIKTLQSHKKTLSNPKTKHYYPKQLRRLA